MSREAKLGGAVIQIGIMISEIMKTFNKSINIAPAGLDLYSAPLLLGSG